MNEHRKFVRFRGGTTSTVLAWKKGINQKKRNGKGGVSGRPGKSGKEGLSPL